MFQNTPCNLKSENYGSQKKHN